MVADRLGTSTGVFVFNDDRMVRVVVDGDFNIDDDDDVVRVLANVAGKRDEGDVDVPVCPVSLRRVGERVLDDGCVIVGVSRSANDTLNVGRGVPGVGEAV